MPPERLRTEIEDDRTMRSWLWWSAMLLGCIFVLGLADAQAQDEDRQARLQELAQEMAAEEERRSARVQAFAERTGTPLRIELGGGRIAVLRDVEDGQPVYVGTTNRGGAETSSVDDVWPRGDLGLSLTGETETLGIWEVGGVVRASHQEFGGRIDIRDEGEPTDHATHVAGTMSATGVESVAKGMAFQGTVHSYDTGNVGSELASASAEGLRVSNHSWGYIKGWRYDREERMWRWFGDPSVSETEDYRFGFYGAFARAWDRISYNAPHHVIVKAAGNDRNDAPSSQPVEHLVWDSDASQWVTSTEVRDPDGGEEGYQSLGRISAAKNIITVGAVEGTGGEYNTPRDVTMSSFSGWGPTDDGRIKPDLVAKGVQVYSALAGSDDDYGTFSGTSMSSPMVSGSVALLQEHFRILHGGQPPRASTMKALLAHTANEAGPPGPDYTFGWGLMNVARAATLISADAERAGSYLREATLREDEVLEYDVLSVGKDTLMATIAWTDPTGVPPDQTLNPDKRMLVNDLDVRIEGPNGTEYQPYVLNASSPEAPATAGDNNRDNVEQVFIEDPVDGTYTVRVFHEGTLEQAPQAFSLAATPPPLLKVPSGLRADASASPGAPTAPVSLRWQTVVERNSEGFVVERRLGPLTPEARQTDEGWTQVDFVPSKATDEISTDTLRYRFESEVPTAGQYAFRLRYVTENGPEEGRRVGVATTLDVPIGGQFSLDGPQPNPSRGDTEIELVVETAQDVRISLYDALGRKVRTVYDDFLAQKRPLLLRVEGQDLSSGTYFLRVTGNEFTTTRKMTIVR
jgi:subtilisin family serine protease